jgi:siroheme synthase
MAAGLNPATPACLIESGTLHAQRQRVTTLSSLRGDGFAGPAIIVIGDVVRFAMTAAKQQETRAA